MKCELCKNETQFIYDAILTRKMADGIRVEHKAEICHVCANRILHYMEYLNDQKTNDY